MNAAKDSRQHNRNAQAIRTAAREPVRVGSRETRQRTKEVDVCSSFVVYASHTQTTAPSLTTSPVNTPPVQLIPSHAAINIPTRESRQSPPSPPDGRRQVVVGEISPRRRRTTAAAGEGR
ncbi:hypothetical protein MRX96_039066 [Rhipicephalus microplus]